MVSIRNFSSNPRDHLSAEEVAAARIRREADRRGRKKAAILVIPVALVLSLLVTIYAKYIDPTPVLMTEPLTNYYFDCKTRRPYLHANTETVTLKGRLYVDQCTKLLSTSHDELVILYLEGRSYSYWFRIYSGDQLVLEENPAGTIAYFFSIALFWVLLGFILVPFAPGVRK